MVDRTEIDVRRVQANLESLLQRVQAGDRVVITQAGEPVAALVPLERTSEHLVGSLRGKLKVIGDVRRTGVKWDALS